MKLVYSACRKAFVECHCSLLITAMLYQMINVFFMRDEQVIRGVVIVMDSVPGGGCYRCHNI